MGRREAGVVVRACGARPVSVFVVADVALHRAGLVRLLEPVTTVRVAGAGPPVREALGDAVRPDIVLLDVASARRVDDARWIRDEVPEAGIVALAVADDVGEIVRCAEVGIRGYVDPDASLEQLVETMECVSRGQSLCSPDVASALIDRLEELAARERGSGRVAAPLTRREREILELVGQGRSNKEIARLLQIELPTVKTHVHHLLAKLHVSRRSEVAALAHEQEAHAASSVRRRI